jgi:probable HAF family extracellular repeat protein
MKSSAIFAGVLLLILCAVSAGLAQTYTVVDLGTLGGSNSEGRAVNSSGQVTGLAYTAGNAVHAFLYSQGQMTDLGTLGGSYSEGDGINAAGEVTGYSLMMGDNDLHAFLYTPARGMVDLNTLLPDGSEWVLEDGHGINNAGQITGYGINPNGKTHAFLYSEGVVTDLGDFGGCCSVGFGINTSGQVTGYSYLAGDTGPHAFLYSQGQMTDLGTIGGSSSNGQAINDSGQVTGFATTAGNFATHVFLYSGGQMTDLGTLGGNLAFGLGINASGQVTGFSYTSTGNLHAFLYSATTGMVDLNTLLPGGSGWMLLWAYAINDVGQITGFGINPNVTQTAFLLTPVASRERKISPGIAYESSIAVDPTNQLHAVVGFNDFSIPGVVNCGWAESYDGGQSWVTGSLQFPSQFHSLGDPWVRYSATGKLVYSCMGGTAFRTSGSLFFKTRTVGVFAALSSSGAATNFKTAASVTTAIQNCPVPQLYQCDKSAEGQFNDHPAIGVLNTPTGFRAVVCWVSSFKNSPNSYLQVSYSDDGTTWPDPRTLAGPQVASCTVGSSQGVIAVTWWDKVATPTSPNGTLKLRSSPDGVSWNKQIITLGDVGQLLSSGTTDKVLSLPYAIPFPANSPGDVAVVWQSRGNESRINVQSSLNGTAEFVDPLAETFLPGAGGCGVIVGGYKVTDGARSFRYVVWPAIFNGVPSPLFLSGVDFSGDIGLPDSRGPRIGDYTGVDCVGNTGWAAWTDGRNGHPEVWASMFPIK